MKLLFGIRILIDFLVFLLLFFAIFFSKTVDRAEKFVVKQHCERGLRREV